MTETIPCASVAADVRGVDSIRARQGKVVVVVEAAYTKSNGYIARESAPREHNKKLICSFEVQIAHRSKGLVSPGKRPGIEIT